MEGGRRANRSGRVLENVVESVFEAHKYKIVSYSEWAKQPTRYDEDRLLLKNVPYKTIYGHTGRSEFVVLLGGKPRIRIECKWQQSPGSVDEKFPYLYLNAVEAMPESTVVIIVDGGGAKESAVAWLRRAAEDRLYVTDPSKTILVFDGSGFIRWANDVLPTLS